jgi:hypothetical protein
LIEDKRKGCGIKVWIGDTMNGHHAETMFSRENMRQA